MTEGQSEARQLEDHRDRRGWVVNPFEHLAETGRVRRCHVFSIEPGYSRGGHLHPSANEEIIVLRGRLEVVCRPGGSRVLSGDRLQIVEIGQGVAHELHNRWEETAVAICWSSRCAGEDGPAAVRVAISDRGTSPEER